MPVARLARDRMVAEAEAEPEQMAINDQNHATDHRSRSGGPARLWRVAAATERS